MRPVAPIPCGASVETNGLKLSVIELSGELSMMRVVAVDPPLDDGLEPPQAASPAASRPAAAMATSLLGVRCVVLMVTFLVVGLAIP